MKRIVMIALLQMVVVLLISSCAGTKIVAEQQVFRDTVIVKEIIRDTIVSVVADSSMLQMLIECDSLGQAHLTQLLHYQAGDKLKPPNLKIKDNVITAIAEVDSMSIYLQLKDKYKEVRRAETTTKTVEINRLTKWQKMMCTLGYISLGAIIAWLGLIILKKLRL